MSYSNKAFIRINSELVEGVSGNAPVDCMTSGLLRHDEQQLWANADPISFTPLSGSSSDRTDDGPIRTFASLRRTTWLQIPWEVYPGLEKVRLRMVAKIDDTKADVLNFEVGVGLRGLGSFHTELIPSTNAKEHRVEWELDSPLEQPVTTDLHIDLRSLPGSLIYSSVNEARGSGPLYRTPGDASLYPAKTYTKKTNDDPALQYTQIGSDFGDPEAQFDHILSPEDGRMYVRPAVPGSPLPIADSPDIYSMSYITIRGVEITFIYGSAYSGVYREMPARQYRANVTVGAPESGQHVDNIIGINSRMRPLYVGPRGKLPATDASAWPTEYHEKFIRVFDDAETGSEILVEQAPIYPSSKDSVIRAHFNWLCYHYVRVYFAGEDLPDTSRAEWTTKLYVEEYDTGTGAWSELASVEETQVTQHYLTDQSGRWTSLLAERLRIRDYRDGGGGDSYVYKEGLLYPEDRVLIDRRTMEVPITWDQESERGPLRFRLTCALDVAGAGAPQYADASDTFTSEKWLTRMLVGCSVWEVPQ